MKSFVFTRKRWFGCFACALLPLAVIVFGILGLTRGVQLDFGIALTFFVFPLLAGGILARLIFSDYVRWTKIVLSGLILIAFVFVSAVTFFLVGFTRVKRYEGAQAERNYAVAVGENTLMPKISELGSPEEIEYNKAVSSAAIFVSEADHLICRYTDEDYEVQKARLEEGYVFQNEPIYSDDALCQPEVTIDEYRFRMLSLEAYSQELYYPKEVMLVGYSEEAKEIAYIFFYDIDLDFISSLEEFIEDDCGWQYIR